uniref:uncharacterized protein n=1 Tax=Myxine glutinosa TaxID=7769 RepID=UPI00358F962F
MSVQQAAGSSLPLLVLTAGMMSALRVEPQNPVRQESNNLTLTCYAEDVCEMQNVMWTFPTDNALIGKQRKREKGHLDLTFLKLSMLHDGARFRCSAPGCENITVTPEVRISIFSPPKDLHMDLPRSPLHIDVEVCTWCNVIGIHPINDVQINWFLGNTSNPLDAYRENYSSSRISSELCFTPKAAHHDQQLICQVVLIPYGRTGLSITRTTTASINIKAPDSLSRTSSVSLPTASALFSFYSTSTYASNPTASSLPISPATPSRSTVVVVAGYALLAGFALGIATGFALAVVPRRFGFASFTGAWNNDKFGANPGTGTYRANLQTSFSA